MAYSHTVGISIVTTTAVTGSTTTPVGASGTDYVMRLHLTGAAAAAWAGMLDHSAFSDIAVFFGGTQIDIDIDQATFGAWSSSNICLWFKLQANIAANTTDTTSYTLQYGNASPTVKNNLDNIYPFWDTFGTGSLDTTKWTNNGQTVSLSGGHLTLSSAGSYPNLTGKVNFGVGYAVRAALTLPSLSAGDSEVDLAFRNGGALPTSAIYAATGNANLTVLQNAGSASTSATFDTQAAGSQVWALARSGPGLAYAALNGAAFTALSDASQQNTNSLPVELSVNDASVVYTYVKVRPWIVAEPVVTSFVLITTTATDSVFVSLTRGTEFNGSGDTSDYANTTSLIAAANATSPVVPLTLALRYDCIVDVSGGNIGAGLIAAGAAGHELAACLEITPTLCTAASVTYNTSGSHYYGAGRMMLLGYTQAQRRALIDTLFAAFNTKFGYYPASAHAWMIDAYSCQYMRDTYNCRVFGICRDQWSTDAYELQGKPENQVYECANNYVMAPASATTKSRMAVFTMHWVDLLNNYGNAGEGYSSTEPVGAAVGSRTIANYWLPMMQDILLHPPVNGSAHRGVSCQYENGFSWSTYGTGFIVPALQQLSAWGNSGAVSLTTAKTMGARFLALTSNTRLATAYRYNSTDLYSGTSGQCLEVSTYAYRARVRWDTNDLAITDLRCYGTNPTDPYYNSALSGEQGVHRVDAALDNGYYSRTALLTTALSDTPANLGVKQQIVYTPDDTSTYYDLFANSGSISPVVSAVPEADGATLNLTEANVGTISYDFRQLGYIVTATRPAVNTGKYYLGHTVPSGVDPADEYYAQSGGGQQSYAAADGTNTTTDQAGMDYLVVVKRNNNAAIIFFILSVTGGTKYGATSKANSVRVGVQGNTGTGNMSFQVAVVPCNKADWATHLAGLQAQGAAYLANKVFSEDHFVSRIFSQSALSAAF